MFTSIDRTLFLLVNRGAANPFFDVLMPVLSRRGFLLAFPVLALALIALLRAKSGPLQRRLFYAVLLAAVPFAAFFLADNGNNILKELIARPRPCRLLDGVRLLVRCPSSFSMPSGHAIASFAYAWTFFLLSRTVVASGWRWYVVGLAAAIAFSRVYVGVHYPSDIAAGTALGLALATVLCAPLLRFRPPGSGGPAGPPPL